MKTTISALFFLPLALFGQNRFLISTIAGTTPSVDAGAAIEALLSSPSDIAFDRQGNLYIADRIGARVLRVSSDGAIRTVAGTGQQGFSGDGGPATEARLSLIFGIAIDANGNLFIADSNNNRVRRVTPQGIITTLIEAPLRFPRGLAVDDGGNLYIADWLNHCIRRLTPGGVLTTVAGTPGTAGNAGDGGLATAARLTFPEDVTLDSGSLVIADTNNHRIRRVDAAGIITTIAGTGTPGTEGDDGAATAARLLSPSAVAAASGMLYISQPGTNRIRVVNAAGTIRRFAGAASGAFGFSADGLLALDAALDTPSAVAVDSQGRVHIADTENHRIRRVNAAGRLETVAGRARRVLENGSATSSEFHFPLGVAVDRPGNVYFSGFRDHRAFRIDSTGAVRTIAGSGERGFTEAGGQSSLARLNFPIHLAVDPDGNVLISDSSNHRIRRVLLPASVISTVAGNSIDGFQPDGMAAAAGPFSFPRGIATVPQGGFIAASLGSNRIRRIDAGGILSTIIGAGALGFGGDGGNASQAQINFPDQVARDDDGNLYFADRNNHRVRKISTQNIINTIAGNGNAGFSGDGGPAIAAQLNTPAGVAVDSKGNVYIADAANQRIRMIPAINGSTGSTIVTIAGTATTGFSGDGGPADHAALSNPTALAVDDQGNVYVTDTNNHRVRKLSPITIRFTAAGLVNAANYRAGPVAAEQIVTLFGEDLAPRSEVAAAGPVPVLAGVRIEITDSRGTTRPCLLIAVTPGQVSFVAPAGLAPGPASLTVRREDGRLGSAAIEVGQVAPGLFSMNQRGDGVAAAVGLRIAPDGSQTVIQVFEFDPASGFRATPIDLDEQSQVYLLLFGTGIRGAPPGSVEVTLDDVPVPVLSSGAQGQFDGLDQINVGPIPRELAGRGEVEIRARVAGLPANRVTVNLR